MNNDIEKKIDEKLKEKNITTMETIENNNRQKTDKTDIGNKQNLDTYQEQIEMPMTSINCPQSIKKEDLKEIDKKPENYIEINMIKNIRIVDNFFISSNLKKFDYKDKKYDIVEKNIYIFPTKKNFYIMTAFYHEDNTIPITFKQKNKGITGKALSILHTPEFYHGLHDPEEIKYNLFIVFFTIVGIGAYCIGLYFLLTKILGII